MVHLRAAIVLCSLTVLCCCCVASEARWHDLRNLRRHQSQRQSELDRLPRVLFGDDAEEESRHRRHRPVEVDDSSSIEDSGEVDAQRSPPRTEFDGDPDYAEAREAELQRAPRRRAVRPRKHHRRHRAHRHRRPTLEDLDEAIGLEYDEGVDLARDKRNQRRKNWTDEDWKAFESSRRPELYDHDIHVFELEVREAQNSSLCNYTVVPIPDPGGRVPRVLEHVKCNYVGNRCRERGSYCCVQTYRNVEVTYPGNKNDTIKVYSGCVCALQIYGTLKPYNPKLPLDD